MQILALVSHRLEEALSAVAPQAVDLAAMVRPTQDASLGDIQINSAMPLAKRLGGSPREWAEKLVSHLQLDEFCQPPQIAGAGFINLTLRNEWIAAMASDALRDPRYGVTVVSQPKTIVIDYSSPNIAKPMHVGHIRSTVIGDALAKIFRFMGHRVITDNHLGDWGTQFGMVIYGYRNFLDAHAFAKQPVAELLRLYKLVHQLIEYHQGVDELPGQRMETAEIQERIAEARRKVVQAPPLEAKKLQKGLAAEERKLAEKNEKLAQTQERIDQVVRDPQLLRLANEHPEIAKSVLEETAKLHEGNTENLRLWNDLLPYSMDEMKRVYARLDIQFDHVLGESFYQPMLAGIVESLQSQGHASLSEGAICIFLPGFDSPMLIQKQDGAFLYATTDLATLQYRQQQFAPDKILYVVDFRQSDHFKKLFAVAPLLGLEKTRLVHVSFGTVLDPKGRPIKTRSGNSAGLESLLDEAVARALSVVCESEHAERANPPLSDSEKKEIAQCVGIGAIKYADLAHHRTSDYKFDLDKMISLDGNTSAYVQYAYARVQGILRAAGTAMETVCDSPSNLQCGHPAERQLLIALLRFEDVLQHVYNDYAPNFLVEYLYEIAKGLAVMYEHCPVLKGTSQELRDSRLEIITLAASILRRGLSLLGIGVVPRM